MSHLFSVILFVLAAIFALFASHFFVYYSLVHFFKIVNPGTNASLGVIIAVLAASFIIASFLAHWKENIFTKAFYFASGLWLGLLINLIITLLAGWVIFAIVRVFGYQINLWTIGVLAIGTAVVITIWGVWSAFNPVIKHIEIRIKDLPDAWKNSVIVHISDVHLGHVFDRNFLEKIVVKINSVKPAAVLITGDLFDGMDGKRLDSQVEPLNSIEAPRGTYFITGNHETYFGVSRALEILSTTKVKILSDETVDVEGLQIIGLNYSDRFEDRDLVKTLESQKNFDPGRPAILMYHSPVQIDALKKTGIDLQLSGHTHKGQMFPFGYITKMVFKGRDYGVYTEGDYSLYTTSGVGTWGPTMRTGKRPEIVVIHFQ